MKKKLKERKKKTKETMSLCSFLFFCFPTPSLFSLPLLLSLHRGPGHEIRPPGFTATCKPLTRLKDPKLGESVVRQEGHISDSI